MKKLFSTFAVVAALASFSGCASPDKNEVTVRYGAGASRIVTTGLDPRDYDEIAQQLYQSVVTSGTLPDGRIVSLGPVGLATGASFDVVTFQESLRTRISRAGKHRFSMTVKAVATAPNQVRSKVEELRQKALQLMVRQEEIDNREDDVVFGGIAIPTHILSGRVSSQTANSRSVSETTYRFNFVLSNVRTGLEEWNDEFTFTKAR